MVLSWSFNFIPELVTSAWRLVVMTYLNQHLEQVRTNSNGKRVKMNIRPECERERRSDNRAAHPAKLTHY